MVDVGVWGTKTLTGWLTELLTGSLKSPPHGKFELGTCAAVCPWLPAIRLQLHCIPRAQLEVGYHGRPASLQAHQLQNEGIGG